MCICYLRCAKRVQYSENPRPRTCIFQVSLCTGSYINGNKHKVRLYRFLFSEEKNTLKLTEFSGIFSLFVIYNLHTTNLQLE